MELTSTHIKLFQKEGIFNAAALLMHYISGYENVLHSCWGPVGYTVAGTPPRARPGCAPAGLGSAGTAPGPKNSGLTTGYRGWTCQAPHGSTL